jgi:hypothetical protein
VELPGIGGAEVAADRDVAGVEQAARDALARQREHHAMADPGLAAQGLDQDSWEIGPADREHRGRDVARHYA